MIILIVLFPRHLDLSLDGHKVVADYSVNWGQYAADVKQFFVNVLKDGDLGFSRYEGETAGQAVARAVGRSLAVIGGALVIGFIFGVFKGILDYRLSRTKLNILGSWTTWLFQSMPDLFVIMIIQWFIVRNFPRSVRFFAVDGWEAFVLPTLLVSMFPIVYIASITSSSLAAQDGKLYLLFAQAKGLNSRIILFRHMLRNSMGTLLIQLPALLVYVLSNLLMVEIFRNFPGAARRLFMALDFNTYPGTGPQYEAGIIIGISFCFMLLVLVVQWISHIAKTYYDPL